MWTFRVPSLQLSNGTVVRAVTSFEAPLARHLAQQPARRHWRSPPRLSPRHPSCARRSEQAAPGAGIIISHHARSHGSNDSRPIWLRHDTVAEANRLSRSIPGYRVWVRRLATPTALQGHFISSNKNCTHSVHGTSVGRGGVGCRGGWGAERLIGVTHFPACSCMARVTPPLAAPCLSGAPPRPRLTSEIALYS